MMKIFVLAFTILISSFTLNAQEIAPDSITVDQAVQAALKNNLDLTGVQLAARIKKRDSDYSFNKFYPTVSTYVSAVRLNEPANSSTLVPTQVPNYYYYYEPNANNLAMGMTFQEVFSVAYFGMIDQAVSDYQKSNITRKKTENTIIANVKNIYYQILVQDESIAVTKTRLDNANERLRQAQVSYDLGQGNELNFTYAKSNVESIIPTLRSMQTQRLIALIQFQELLGYSKNENTKLEGKIPEDSELKETKEKNTDFRFDVQENKNSVEQLEKALKLQDMSLLPNIVLKYTTDPTYNNPKMDGIFKKENWNQSSGALSLTLSFSLDSFIPGSDYWIKRADTQDQLSLAQKNVAVTIKNAAADLEIQRRQIQDSLDKIENLKNVVTYSKKSYELTNIAYKAGSGRILDLQDAELSLQNAQIQLLNERLNLMSLINNFDAAYDN